MDKNIQIRIPINIKNNKEANIFLRKLFADLRPFESSFLATPGRISKKQIVSLGLLTIAKKTIGVSCDYKKRGTIKTLIFDDVPVDFSQFIENIVQGSLRNYKDDQPQIKIAYSFESPTHYIEPFSGDNFEISLDEKDYSNIFSIYANGFDAYDVFTFNQYIFDSVLDVMSLYYKIPFDTRHKFSDRYSSLLDARQYVNTDDDFNKYESIKLDKVITGVIESVSKIPPESTDDKVYRMARLFRDGLRIERYGDNNYSINFKEAAHSLYMSCLEVVSMSDEKEQKCIKCGQPMYKISERVSSFIYEMSGSDNLRKYIKTEYAKRSKYLHTGRYFSANNLHVGEFIPQLSTSSQHGHILQVNHMDSLNFIKEILRGIMIKELSDEY